MTRTADNRDLARERSLARARTRFLATIPEDRAAHWRSKWSHDDAAFYLGLYVKDDSAPGQPVEGEDFGLCLKWGEGDGEFDYHECEDDELDFEERDYLAGAEDRLPDYSMIAVDQWGHVYPIPGKHPRKELLERLGRQHADRIYRDKRDGPPVHVGYIITPPTWAPQALHLVGYKRYIQDGSLAGLWLSLYAPFERPIGGR